MISVAICTYNGETYLGEQLDSIARQTLPPDELVACDDCSSDRTIEVLKNFAERVAFPVHIHSNQSNLGSTKNFEKAIGHCSGEIIFLSDQDDVWKTNKIERLKSALDSHSEVGYVFSDAELVDQNLQPLGCNLWESIGFQGGLRSSFNSEEQLAILVNKNVVTGATMAFRSQAAGRAAPFPDNWVHDSWIAHIASSTTMPGLPIEECLILYRQHATQQIGTKTERAEEDKSLAGKYRDLKQHHQAQFADWEMRGQRIVTLNEALSQISSCNPGMVPEQTLDLLSRFETHFINRHEILTSKNPKRYRLILREALSGRYGQFSDSWRSIFRDLFL